ncbi:hypothetical protein EV198_0969 [Roseivirga ehrenbergii]|nr:hypothetical protein [Roseivirga ehrenbergii]TCL14129.1 hypothetical protein EV198_0969 [Roseivirga ehrenbergii]
MKVRNYNKILSALAIVGITVLMVILIKNNSGSSKSKNHSSESVDIVQVAAKEAFETVSNKGEKIKIFDTSDTLIAEFVEGEPVNIETLKLYRQADFLSKFNNLAIYKLSE